MQMCNWQEHVLIYQKSYGDVDNKKNCLLLKCFFSHNDGPWGVGEMRVIFKQWLMLDQCILFSDAMSAKHGVIVWFHVICLPTH